MKKFKIKSKHFEFPENLKHDLDAITTHGYEVVKVGKNELELDELPKDQKSYNYLLDENNREIRELLKSHGLSYVELDAYKRDFRPLGISWMVVRPGTSERANYLLIKSSERNKEIPLYKENLCSHHDEASKKYSALAIIYGIFLASVFFLQNRVVRNLSIYGYYILSAILICLFIAAFYKCLRHNELKKAIK